MVNFSVQHQYVDDGLAGTLETPGNGTTSDASTITVTVTDDDSNNGGNATSVTVSNAAPTMGTLSATAIQENGTTTLTGTFTDIGLRDLHGVTINWGDPNNSVSSQFVLPAVRHPHRRATFASGIEDDDTVLTITSVDTTTGQVGFSVQHQYVDDGAAPGNSTTSDNNTITVTVNDDDGQSASDTTTVTVSNVAPTLSDLSPATQTINEGGSRHGHDDHHRPGHARRFHRHGELARRRNRHDHLGHHFRQQYAWAEQLTCGLPRRATARGEPSISGWRGVPG